MASKRELRAQFGSTSGAASSSQVGEGDWAWLLRVAEQQLSVEVTAVPASPKLACGLTVRLPGKLAQDGPSREQRA